MKKSVLDILFWLGMAVLITWIIAKLFGIINTPEWINLIPLITLAFLIGIFYQDVKSFMGQMYIRTDWFKNKLNNHEERLNDLEK